VVVIINPPVGAMPGSISMIAVAGNNNNPAVGPVSFVHACMHRKSRDLL